jgi:SAM-dependent methyltransferase
MEVDVRGWMRENERLFLKRLAFGKDVLELGAYEGLSTVTMAATARRVTAVDTFDGRATPEPKETLDILVGNLEAVGLRAKVRVCRGTTEEVLPTLEGPFDLVFIDCDHAYEAVRGDIRRSLPLLKPGGVLALHDYDAGHPGVVRAVDELRAGGGWPAFGQEGSLVALGGGSGGPPREPVVYVVMPHRDLRVHLGASEGLHFASLNKYRQVVSNYGTSVLTQCFNHLFCEALNARATDGVTHFAMLHNDVIPCKGWLDVLMGEMDAGGYDVVSAVVPLKNSKGLTSTGLDTPGNPWSVRRLTMTEVCELPPTFTAADVPFRRGEAQLLLNTGCWLMKLDRPFVDGLCFRQQDCISWVPSEGRYVEQSISEDWDFSRQLHTRGAKIAATRAVPVVHERPEFHNRGVWGEWRTDLAYEHYHREAGDADAPDLAPGESRCGKKK